MLLLRRAQRGRIRDVKRTRSPAGVRSRTFTRRTSTGPIPVWTVRPDMAVADDAGPAIGEPLVGHRRQEGFGLRLDRLGE